MELQTAIYTTLLHSLWMGLILALVTSIIIMSTRNQSAAMRYNLLAGTLVIFVLSICVVFYNNLNSDFKQEAVYEQQVVIKYPITEKVQTAVDDSLLSGAKSVVSFWGNYSNQIVLIWFLVICAKSIQLLIGLQGIRHIKTNKVFSAGTLWEQKVIDISRKLNITKQVIILQSGLARVPMLVGHFKPIILIPLGLLNNLNVNDVEAIITHELAHLKRNDYLVNLFQSFVEIVFFFNPGVLWISKLIKEERENCCDDLALTCIESKHQYIKALLVCEEFSSSYPNYAMAIIGRRNSLKDRVSRMVFDSNKSLNKLEKTLLSITLVSLLIISTAFTKVHDYVTENRILTVKGVTVFFRNTSQDTAKKQLQNRRINKAIKPKTGISGLKQSQQKVDTRVASDVSDEIKKARAANDQKELEEVRAYEEDVKAYQEDVKRYQSDVRNQQKEIKSYQAEIVAYQNNLKKYQAEVAKYAADPANNSLPQAPIAPVIAMTPVVPVAPIVPIRPAETRIKAISGSPVSITVNKPLSSAGSITPRNGKLNVQPSKKDDMTAELKKDGLLKDTSNFEYTLNEKGLIINGIKQPESIHRKYLRFLKNKKGTITTKVKTN